MDTMQRSECESDQPERYGHLRYGFVVQCRFGGRVRRCWASTDRNRKSLSRAASQRYAQVISAREAPWFSLSSSAPRPTRTTPSSRAGARIEQAVACCAVRRPLLPRGRVHKPQPSICGLSISRAPLQASTSSSCARSGKPSRTRNSSSFHEPLRIFTLPARHCVLNGPNIASWCRHAIEQHDAIRHTQRRVRMTLCWRGMDSNFQFR